MAIRETGHDAPLSYVPVCGRRQGTCILTEDDIPRLLPGVLEALSKLITFSRGVFFPLERIEESFVRFGLTPRQRNRALKILLKGRPFWDRIGKQILLPVRNNMRQIDANYPTDPHTGDQQYLLGVVALLDAPNTSGPEEENRWLPLLQDWLQGSMVNYKLRLVLAKRHEIPSYAILAAKRYLESRKGPCSLLHLLEKSGSRPASRHGYPFTVKTCNGIWAGNIEVVGITPTGTWLFLPDCDQASLSRGIKLLARKCRVAGRSLSGAIGHCFDELQDARHIEAMIKGLEESASLIGTTFFSTADNEEFARITGSKNLTIAVGKIKRLIRGRHASIAFMNPIPGALLHMRNENEFLVETGGTGGFYIKTFLSDCIHEEELGRLKDHLEQLTKKAPGKPTIGLASSKMDFLTSKDSIMASVWAYIHALRLGTGSIVIHDGLTWHVTGDELLGWGDAKAACRAYKYGIKADPEQPDLLNSLGVCLVELGRFKEATKHFRMATRLDPLNFMAFYNIAGILFKRGDLYDAEIAAKAALDIRPSDHRALTRMANILMALGRYAEAVLHLENAISNLDGKASGTLYRKLGKAYMEIDRWAEAKEAWRKALAKNPSDSHSMAYLSLGYLERDKDRQTAERFYRSASRLPNSSSEAGKLLRYLGKKLKNQRI